MSALELYAEGGRVWIENATTVWNTALLTPAYNGSSLEITDEEGNTIKITVTNESRTCLAWEIQRS